MVSIQKLVRSLSGKRGLGMFIKEKAGRDSAKDRNSLANESSDENETNSKRTRRSRKKKENGALTGETKIDTTSTTQATESGDHDHPRLIIARAFLRAWNDHDMETVREYVTPDYMVHFKDCAFEFADYAHEIQKVFEAMPDFTFSHKNFEYVPSNDTVVLHNVVPNGHHTMKSYAFGPYEPIIEPKGTYVKNSPETITYHFRDGKICKETVVAHGEMTGLAGIYTQLGGFPLM